MQTLTVEYPLQLSRAQAWQFIRDLSRPQMYVPRLTANEFTTSQQEGLGASRRVTQGKSMQLDETVTRWTEGEGFTLRLHRGDTGPIPPFKSHYFDYGLVERDGQVYLRNSMRYELGMGLFGKLLDRLFLKRFILSQLDDVTLAQKIYYESGQQVTPAMLKLARASRGS
jgi:hypothetical protein